MKFAEIDGCPVPESIAPLVMEVKKRTGATLESCYRGSDSAGVAILNANGKHSQQQLFDGTPAQRAAWGVLGTPDRPGTSTHEFRSDGVAFSGPVGRKISDYQVGQDWPDADIPQVMAAYRALGELPIHPYASGIEYHHIDLTKPPRIPYPFLPQERGHKAKGIWIYILSARLEKCGYLGYKTSRFDRGVQSAVEAFQRDHHLTVDGVVGIHSWMNLKAAARAAKKGKQG